MKLWIMTQQYNNNADGLDQEQSNLSPIAYTSSRLSVLMRTGGKYTLQRPKSSVALLHPKSLLHVSVRRVDSPDLDGARRWNGKRVGHAAKRHRASRTQDAGEQSASSRVLHCIVQHLVVRFILQMPEMMPHSPVPADISASITAGGGTRTQGTRVSVPALAR